MLSRFRKRKIDRKRDFCLNCNYPMPDDYNFCPMCGQENVDNKAAISMLAEEFINTFFAYDSRFVRSIVPFLFKPGYLTNQFLLGRRLTYVHPLRLYLIVSILYFTVISLEINVKGNVFQSGLNEMEMESERERADSIASKVQKDLQKEGLHFDVTVTDDSTRKKTKRDEGIVLNFGDKDSTGNSKGFNLTKIKQWSQDRQMTPEAVLDSLGLKQTYWNRRIAEQSLKVVQRDTESLIEYLLEKVSLMMFLLLPFVAVLLKLLYIRSKRYYIEHLVFTLHIHSFLFFLLLIVSLVLEVYDNGYLLSALFFWLFLYMLLSFLNVYHQGWFKTLTKMFILFICYVISLSFFMVATLIVSFLLF
jgi:hypothetical protein